MHDRRCGITGTQMMTKKKETSWLSIGDALNNTLTEVQRKTHNPSKSIWFYVAAYTVFYVAAYTVFINTKRDLTVWGPSWVMDFSFLRFLYHTQRHTTVGRTTPDKWSARRRDFWLHTTLTADRKQCLRWDSDPQSQQPSGRRLTRGHWDRHN